MKDFCVCLACIFVIIFWYLLIICSLYVLDVSQFIDQCSYIDSIQHSDYLVYADNIDKSFDRIKDFINLVRPGGSGSYPEDFHYHGYRRDNGSIIYSKSPTDWGIIENFNFGDFNDLSKRSASGIQMANWLEYDWFVQEQRRISLNGENPTFNASGIKWFQQYCSSKNIDKSPFNTSLLREHIRNIK